MLRVEGAVVQFDTRAVVDGVDLAVGAGETVAVLGPSGCGKSTLLRAIAGLEPLAAGRVTWDGDDLTATPPHERRFGLMFQDYALFPHRDVRGNVEFGLRMAGVSAAQRARRVDEVLALVGLRALADRRVAHLSGGEQQRVALARTLAPEPRLLMLDEPLGALDRALRERLIGELQELLGVAGLPVVYVTHDHEEAFTLAQRLVVMRDGRVVQTGTPASVWARPADAWVAEFLGFGPLLDAEVDGAGATTPWGRLPVPDGATRGRGLVVLRPGAVSLATGPGAPRGTVRHARFGGDRAVVAVEVDGGPMLEVRVAARDVPAVGDDVRLGVDPEGVLVYPAESVE